MAQKSVRLPTKSTPRKASKWRMMGYESPFSRNMPNRRLAAKSTAEMPVRRKRIFAEDSHRFYLAFRIFSAKAASWASSALIIVGRDIALVFFEILVHIRMNRFPIRRFRSVHRKKLRVHVVHAKTLEYHSRARYIPECFIQKLGGFPQPRQQAQQARLSASRKRSSNSALS